MISDKKKKRKKQKMAYCIKTYINLKDSNRFTQGKKKAFDCKVCQDLKKDKSSCDVRRSENETLMIPTGKSKYKTPTYQRFQYG